VLLPSPDQISQLRRLQLCQLRLERKHLCVPLRQLLLERPHSRPQGRDLTLELRRPRVGRGGCRYRRRHGRARASLSVALGLEELVVVVLLLVGIVRATRRLVDGPDALCRVAVVRVFTGGRRLGVAEVMQLLGARVAT
jgi:hypothetical protein